MPFGHVHLLTGMLDVGLDVQAALDAPRVFAMDGMVAIEGGVPGPVRQRLAALGHDLAATGAPLGGGQAIWIDRDRGILIGGSDPRKDGCALGY